MVLVILGLYNILLCTYIIKKYYYIRLCAWILCVLHAVRLCIPFRNVISIYIYVATFLPI